MTDTRRPLGAGIVTLIVIDAILVLTLVLMLLQMGRAGGPAVATPGATTASADVVAFASPSRNISCTIGRQAATCAIAEFDYAPPIVAGCTGRTGYEIQVTGADARWLCTSGEPPAAAGEDVEVLDYGASAAANGFTCQSTRDGVTCRHDESGRSFSLARAEGTFGEG